MQIYKTVFLIFDLFKIMILSTLTDKNNNFGC